MKQSSLPRFRWIGQLLGDLSPRRAGRLAWVGAVAVLLLGSWAGCGRDAPPLWKQTPGEPLTVLVTGKEFNWYIHYPGPDGELGTADDIQTMRNLHLPVGTQVKVQLTSEDYIYTLAFPHMELKQIAVPELEFFMELETGAAGTFELLGDQLCGYTHPDLLGKLIVHSQKDFEAWLRETQRNAEGPKDDRLGSSPG